MSRDDFIPLTIPQVLEELSKLQSEESLKSYESGDFSTELRHAANVHTIRSARELIEELLELYCAFDCSYCRNEDDEPFFKGA
jgi:hypothetical protein